MKSIDRRFARRSNEVPPPREGRNDRAEHRRKRSLDFQVHRGGGGTRLKSRFFRSLLTKRVPQLFLLRRLLEIKEELDTQDKRS